MNTIKLLRSVKHGDELNSQKNVLDKRNQKNPKKKTQIGNNIIMPNGVKKW